MQPVVVYDLATLRFRRSPRKTSMSIIAASGEVLAVCDTSVADTDEDAAYAACEHALSAGRSVRDGVVHRVCLYNPHTAETSYLPAPESIVFGDAAPIALEAHGTIGCVRRIDDTGDEPVCVLEVSGRAVERRVYTVAAATRAWDANQDRRGR